MAIRTAGDVTIWDTSTGQPAGVLPVSGTRGADDGPVAVSPRGTLIAVATGTGMQLWSAPYLTDPAA